MAVIVTFDTRDVTQEQYDGIIRDLEAEGLGAPQGRLSHVAGMGPDGWHVTDVWESQEAFGRFGERLLPIIQKNGASVQPMVFPAHNYVPGK